MLETIIKLILPNIFEIVLTIISLIVVRHVIPWLKEKQLINIIKKFVQAAEKLAESGTIDKTEKKKMVVSLLENKGIIVDETIDAFIESCVKELDMATSIIYEEIMRVEED